MNSWKMMGGLGLSLAMLVSAGCAMDTNGDETVSEAEAVGEIKSALTPVTCGATYDACWDQTDSSGKISIRLYMCKESAADSWTSVACSVETDRVLVGGGVQESTFGASGNGSLLIATLPSGEIGGTWVGISKAHVYPDVHKSRAFAIGLRLAGFNANQLAAAVQTTSATSGTDPHPGAVALKPAGHILLGGGAATDNSNQLITGSTPTNAGWVAKSRDHIITAPGKITAYAITMPSCPVGLAYCLTSDITTVGQNAPSGYHTWVNHINTPNSIMVSVGGDAFSGGAGRMIVSLAPYPAFTGQVFMQSKDHGFTDNGSDTASIVSLRKL